MRKRLYTFLDLALATNEELEKFMRSGVMPDVRDLVGYEFKGFNTLDVTALLGFRKFMKGFYAPTPLSGPRDRIRGYNVRVQQNGIGEPWVPVRKGAKVVRHGAYDVYPVDPALTDNYYPNAVLIDYDCGRNPWYDPTNFLRDYLVQVYPDSKDLFLGKAYIAIGPRRVFVSFFVLERGHEPEEGAEFP